MEPSTIESAPSKRAKPEVEDIKVEVLKAIALQSEKKRSGKQRARFRVFVVASNGKGKVGLGIKGNKNKETAIQLAGTQAKSEMFHVALTPFDIEDSDNHTISQQLHGKYGDLEITLTPASKGTGIESSALIKFLLNLIGIKDCVVLPESTHGNNSANIALAAFSALGKDFRPS